MKKHFRYQGDKTSIKKLSKFEESVKRKEKKKEIFREETTSTEYIMSGNKKGKAKSSN